MEVYAAGETVYCQFNTRDGDGAPITFAGSPAVAVRKDNGTTTDTDGVTLTVDSGSVTGLHTLSIDTSQDETFYATGHEFFVIVTSGTVDSTSVVGEVVHRFRLGEVPADVQAWDGGAVPSLATPDDIPTVEEIDTELTANHGSGAWGSARLGDYDWTETFTDSESNPIEDVLVTIYSDSDRTTLVTSGYTATDGTITLYVSSEGTYYFRATKTGYTSSTWSEAIS